MSRILSLLVLFSLSELCFSVEIDGFTAPSADVTLSFIRSGQVSAVSVTEGELVRKGQLLIQLDDSLEQAKISKLEADVNNDVKKRIEQDKLTQKERDLVALEDARRAGATSIKEIETARLEVSQLKLSIELLAFEKLQILKKIDEEKILQQQTQLYTPINGLVESLLVEKGESAERLKQVVRVVNIDPLWVEVNIPLEYSSGLKRGQKVSIQFPGNPQAVLQAGEIIFRSSVADPGSDTLRFRVKVANKSHRIVGERVKLILAGE